MSDNLVIESTESVKKNNSSSPVQGIKNATTDTSAPPSFDATVSSMGELREKYPEYYKKMLEGMLSNILIDMRRHAEHIKEAYKRVRHR